MSVPAASPEPAPREGQTFAGASRFIAYANLVKLPHTVFALPFALVSRTEDFAQEHCDHASLYRDKPLNSMY